MLTLAGIGLVAVALSAMNVTKTISDLLLETKELKMALSNLMTEEQIGYAKVIKQEIVNGETYTTLKFVETERDNQLEKILESEYTIKGDIVYFDALIVRFGPKVIKNGSQKSLYLWRRIYGEDMAPSKGFSIEQHGSEPKRYKGILSKLPIHDQKLFWTEVWSLANDPKKLSEHDVSAVYGNAVYSKLRPGLIYIFKISGTGQVYPETVPDF